MSLQEHKMLFIHFYKYLKNIGFLNLISSHEFKKIYVKLKEENNNNLKGNLKSIFFKDLLSKCIVNFLEELTEDKKKILGINLYKKFSENEAEYLSKLNENKNDLIRSNSSSSLNSNSNNEFFINSKNNISK